MLHSRDFDTPEPGETELRHLYERALERSAQLRARRARLRVAGGTAALACLLAVGLVTASLAATTPGPRPVAGPSISHPAWRLVSQVSAAGSSWQALSPSGYQQTFSLVCPSDTTCYADSAGGHLEYTSDGGTTWQQAAGTGTATSGPQISCPDARDCNVLADIAGRGSTFLTTTDGGQAWTSQPGPAASLGGLPTAPPSPSQSGLAADAMSCATISSCVVIAYHGDFSGSFSEVFTTSDGGTSWTQDPLRSPSSGDYVPSDLSCTGPTCVTVGSIVGPYTRFKGGPGQFSGQGVRPLSGTAYTSDDGGATWSASLAPPSAADGQVTSLTCPDATDCYAVATAAVFETVDGGQTWHKVSTSGLHAPSASYHGWGFGSMSCASSSSCWLAGAALPDPRTSFTKRQEFSGIGQAEGLLASTADGGSTWALSTPPAGVGGVIDVTCPTTTTCFALGVEQTGSAPSDSEVMLLTNAS